LNGTEIGGAFMTPESVDPAVTNKAFVGSCMLFEAESIDIVRKLVEEDVYYKNDVVCVLPAALINIETLRYIMQWDKDRLVILPIALATSLPPIPS
jgi:hypothetical protein